MCMRLRQLPGDCVSDLGHDSDAYGRQLLARRATAATFGYRDGLVHIFHTTIVIDGGRKHRPEHHYIEDNSWLQYGTRL